jgi:hypothetical protein
LALNSPTLYTYQRIPAQSIFQEPPDGKELKLRDDHHNRHNKSNQIEEEAEEVT